MSMNIPQSQKEVFSRALADFQNELPQAGPFLRNNFIYALLVAFSARNFDNYQLLSELIDQMFPDTATGEYAVRWGSLVDTFINQPTASSGPVVTTGLLNSSIPIDTQYQTEDGLLFTVTAPATIALNTLNVTSLVRSGNSVTVTTNGNHNLATGMNVNVSGADQGLYNGEFSIVVTSPTTFVYSIPNFPLSSPPASPATGTIIVLVYSTPVQVQALTTGASTNLESGTQLTILTPLNGVNSTAYVGFGGLAGGADIETSSRYRKRYIYKYQNPVALFNEAAIVSNCMELPFVDRVFVQPITPLVGQVTVYILKSITTGSIIPSVTEIAQVKANLMTIKPANTDPSDVFVLSPTPHPIDFSFSNLSPNTVSMQNAIKNSLGVLFNEYTEVGVNLLQAAYESAIYQTVDLTNGNTVATYTLSAPTGTVTMASNEIPTLGDVTFS